MKIDPLEALKEVAQILFDKKAANILAIDVRKISTLTEFFLIAEGGVQRHVTALGKVVIEFLKKKGEIPLHAEGLQEGDWVVLDYMEMVIHLFTPEMREKYCLEKLWKKGKIVDLEILVSKNK